MLVMTCRGIPSGVGGPATSDAVAMGRVNCSSRDRKSLRAALRRAVGAATLGERPMSVH